MNIALIGASGFIGSAIRKEALSRKHKVTALVSDPSKLQPERNLDIQQTDVLDTERLAQQLRGRDLVISAFSGHADADIYGYYLKGIRSLVEAVRTAGVSRLLLVGARAASKSSPASSSWTRRNSLRNGRPRPKALGQPCRSCASCRTWIGRCSARRRMSIRARALAEYRTGLDAVIQGDGGPADISLEDYAVAMVDGRRPPSTVGSVSRSRTEGAC
jgi:putative NADH-flavin reductase